MQGNTLMSLCINMRVSQPLMTPQIIITSTQIVNIIRIVTESIGMDWGNIPVSPKTSKCVEYENIPTSHDTSDHYYVNTNQ